jgi:hypothetical protein
VDEHISGALNYCTIFNTTKNETVNEEFENFKGDFF